MHVVTELRLDSNNVRLQQRLRGNHAQTHRHIDIQVCFTADTDDLKQQPKANLP